MWKYLKKYRVFAILAPLFMIGEVSMDLIQPRLMNEIVDNGVLGLGNGGTGSLEIILSTGLKMIGTVAVGGTFGILCGVFANLCAQSFSNDVRKAAFAKIMTFSAEQTHRFSTGSLITRVTNDITQVETMVQMCIRGFVRNLMFFVGGIFCMLKLDLSFGVCVGCALPFLLVMVVFFVTKANPLYGKLQSKLDKVNSVMQENVTGARVVKAFARENYEKERFGKANGELIGTQLNVLLLLSYLGPLMNIVLNITVVAVIRIGGIKVEEGSVTPGNVMAAITYVSQILNGVMMIANVFQNISRGSASAKRINEVLDTVPAIADGKGVCPPETGSVEFRGVTFSYPEGNGETILRDISFRIDGGETVGILGATGCGKTTLVSLIPRFYDCTEGEVLVDGENVRDYKLSELRRRIAFTLQKSELFSVSIAENIRWGDPCATDDDVKRAAVTAQADGFIVSQPDGYGTMVAEKGASLSGGQKQRVAVARSILKNSEIMIFDDSTSALDLKTEADLYRALGVSAGNATKIIIAQRIASVRNADRILVLDAGGIAGFAPHDELMRTCAQYKDIYDSQLGE